MEFYDREPELEILEKHWRQSARGAILDVLTGRRRIGKTELVRQFMKGKPALYFFVSRKPLSALLKEWSEVLGAEFPHLGEFLELDDFLKGIFNLGRTERLVVVFDEFQNFKYLEPAAFSIFQKQFDEHKKTSKILLIMVGSLVTMMEKIFSDAKEPLFGRATRKLSLSPFPLSVVGRILRDLAFPPDQSVFDLFSVLDGIPRYYALLEEEELQGRRFSDIVRELFLQPESPLKLEGEDILREEFGKDYQRYFEILSLIASGKIKLSEIAGGLRLPATTVHTYVSNLEKRFGIIERRLPLLVASHARYGRYYLKDTFLAFWFRFVYRHISWIERGAGDMVARIIARDIPIYQGWVFEELARETVGKLSLDPHSPLPFPLRNIGRYWDRRGKEEIDIV